MNYIVAIKDFPAADWQKLLNDFADKVADHVYKKIEYMRWRCLKPADQIIKVCLNQKDYSPYIDICNGIMTTTVTAEDSSFGEFLFENIFNEEEQNMAYNNTITSNAVHSDYTVASAISALETKADYCEGLSASGAIAKATISPDKIAANTITVNDDALTITGTKSDWSYSDHTVTKAISGDDMVSNSGWISCDLETRPTFNDVEHMIDKKLKEKEKDKENEKMKGFNFDFGPVDEKVRMSMYGLAVKNAAGTYVSYDATNDSIMDVDIFNFDASKFLFKMPCAIKDIAVGDVIVHQRCPMYVVNIPEDGKSVIVVDITAGERKAIMPTKSPFGFNFVTKVVNLLGNMMTANPTADNPFGNMLPFMLMENSNDFDPMMFMFMNNSCGNMNPMMLYMIAKNKDDDDFMKYFMLSNMMAGSAT